MQDSKKNKKMIVTDSSLSKFTGQLVFLGFPQIYKKSF